MKASQKWKIERILYLALIPISYWFVMFFINSHSDINSLNMLLSNTSNKILLSIFFIISMLHIRIQLGKVYEDYFKLKQMKFYSLLTDLGITRELENKVENWSYNKLNEVTRIAPIVKAKMKKNGII